MLWASRDQQLGLFLGEICLRASAEQLFARRGVGGGEGQFPAAAPPRKGWRTAAAALHQTEGEREAKSVRASCA